MQRARLVAVATIAAAFAITPAVTFAQQMPVPPDGTSINEAPAAGAQAAVDACGNTPQTAFGNATETGMPQNFNADFPKDNTGAQQTPNLSAVTGVVLHTAGDLVLIRIPRTPASGLETAPPTPDRTLAVVRLPSGCWPSLNDGQQVKAVGMPSMDGILNAEMVQTTD